MTSTEENTSPPEWLIRLEKKEKSHRLAHEIGAGSPCLKCADKCPGLDLHFWRKLCRNCKCKKEDHDVVEDDSYSHFNILFCSSITKNSIKPKKAVLELCLKNGKERNVTLDWTPPNIAPDLAIGYMERLPQDKLPISNSDGAVYRRQQLEKQIPLHDFDPKLCHELTPAESKNLEEYATNVRNSVVGQGRVVRIPVVRGFTSTSTVLPTAKSFRTINVSGRTKEKIELPMQNQKWLSERSGENLSNSSSRSSSPMRTINPSKENFFEGIAAQDANYERFGNARGYEISSLLNQPIPKFSQELKSNYNKNAPPYLDSNDTVMSRVRNPVSFLEFSEATQSQDPQYVDVNNKGNHSQLGNVDNVQNNTADPQNYKKKTFSKEKNENQTANIIDNHNYLVNSDEELPGNHQMFSEQSHAPSSISGHKNNVHQYGNDKFRPSGAHFSVTKSGLPLSYLEHSKDLENKNPNYSIPFNADKLPHTSFHSELPNKSGINSSNYNYLNQGLGENDSLSPFNNLNRDQGIRIGRDSKKSSPNLSPSNLSKLSSESEPFTYVGNQLGKENYKNFGYEKELLRGDESLGFQMDDEKLNNGLETLSLKEEINCEKCEELLEIGSIAVAVEKKGKTMVWHPECFICSMCSELLVDLLYFYHKKNVYCGRDYAAICGIPRCYACDELIFMKSYTQAEGHSFHLRHFCCLECDTTLADKEYITMNGHPICLPCYDSHYAKCCQKCGGIISATEKAVRLNELTWHATEKCFLCQYCNISLLNSKFTLKNNQAFCNQICVREFCKQP